MNRNELERWRTGLLIRHAREAKSLSQTDLSKLSGISQPFIANIEAGRRGVTPQIAKAIEAPLDLPALAIVGMGYVKQLLAQEEAGIEGASA